MTLAPPRAAGIAGTVRAVRAALDVVVRELLKFGMVGAVAYVVDVGTFNVLRFVGHGHGLLEYKPLTAKVISVSLATLVAWVGNRYWTFRHRRRASRGRELAAFVFMNGIAMLLALGCLGLSHYVLRLQTPLADNISANVVGLALGTTFRFWAYKRHVFTELEVPGDVEAAVAETDVAAVIEETAQP